MHWVVSTIINHKHQRLNSFATMTMTRILNVQKRPKQLKLQLRNNSLYLEEVFSCFQPWTTYDTLFRDIMFYDFSEISIFFMIAGKGLREEIILFFFLWNSFQRRYLKSVQKSQRWKHAEKNFLWIQKIWLCEITSKHTNVVKDFVAKLGFRKLLALKGTKILFFYKKDTANEQSSFYIITCILVEFTKNWYVFCAVRMLKK